MATQPVAGAPGQLQPAAVRPPISSWPTPGQVAPVPAAPPGNAVPGTYQPYQMVAAPGPTSVPGYPAPGPGYAGVGYPGSGYPGTPVNVQADSDLGERGHGPGVFFGRLMLGAGFGSVSGSHGGGGSGKTGAGLSGSAGWFLAENLALHGDLIIISGLAALGAGATYYLTPLDLYGSASALAASSSGATGGGLALTAGKQWRLADPFSLGAGAQLFAGTLSASGGSVSVVTFTVGVVGTIH
jgi:hypothetical protein